MEGDLSPKAKARLDVFGKFLGKQLVVASYVWFGSRFGFVRGFGLALLTTAIVIAGYWKGLKDSK